MNQWINESCCYCCYPAFVVSHPSVPNSMTTNHFLIFLARPDESHRIAVVKFHEVETNKPLLRSQHCHAQDALKNTASWASPQQKCPNIMWACVQYKFFFFTHHLILSRGHVCRKPRAIQSPTAPQAVLIDQGAGEDIDLAILPQDRTGTWMIPGSYRWTLAEPWFSTQKNLFHSQPLIYGYYMVNILLILVEYGYYMVIYYMVNNG
jgi:hypothetical protein